MARFVPERKSSHEGRPGKHTSERGHAHDAALCDANEAIFNSDATNTMYFTPFATFPNEPREFFRAAQGYPVVALTRTQDAIEPATTNDVGQAGRFSVFLSQTLDTNLTVVYRISGSASNGVDYTYMSGSVMIPAGTQSKELYIQPLFDGVLEFDESVDLTLVLTNGYLIDPTAFRTTIWIEDSSPVTFDVVATNLVNPVGIDYHPGTNALIVSVDSWGGDYRFVRIGTNGPAGFVTNWSEVTASSDEKKLAIVQTGGPLTNASGFTNGYMYFGNGNEIGQVSSNSAVFDLAWATNLTTGGLRGGLHVDRSGSWGENLIAVTSGGSTSQRVWRMRNDGTNHLVAEIVTGHLEGVVTLTNDVERWGPWAGKVITGDENQHQVYAVETNGTITTWDIGIRPEDFDIIRANQDLYCTDADSGLLVRLASTYFTNCVDDILVTQAGEGGFPPYLFVVHWDGENFNARRILGRHVDTSFMHFEHVTFAPIRLQNLTP